MQYMKSWTWDAGAPTGSHIADRTITAVPGKSRRIGARRRKSVRPIRSELTIRSIARIVGTFRQGVQQGVPSAVLAPIAMAALELARIEFELRAWKLRRNAQWGADCDQCLVELEALATALSNGNLAPSSVLVHAMDTLIVLLVQFDTPNPAQDRRKLKSADVRLIAAQPIVDDADAGARPDRSNDAESPRIVHFRQRSSAAYSVRNS